MQIYTSPYTESQTTTFTSHKYSKSNSKLGIHWHNNITISLNKLSVNKIPIWGHSTKKKSFHLFQVWSLWNFFWKHLVAFWMYKQKIAGFQLPPTGNRTLLSAANWTLSEWMSVQILSLAVREEFGCLLWPLGLSLKWNLLHGRRFLSSQSLGCRFVWPLNESDRNDQFLTRSSVLSGWRGRMHQNYGTCHR